MVATVRPEEDPLACWIHAIVHKIEGDAGNSRYWCSQTPHAYDEFADTEQELAAPQHEGKRMEAGRVR